MPYSLNYYNFFSNFSYVLKHLVLPFQESLGYSYLLTFTYDFLPTFYYESSKNEKKLKELCSKQTLINTLLQFSSVTQSCPTLCDPSDYSTPGLHVRQQLLEPTQTHVHWVGDAIQPSHPLSSPSPPTFSLSQHQGLFQRVSSLHQVAKVFYFQLPHQSFQWILRTDFL